MISLIFTLIGIYLRLKNIGNDYLFSGESGKEFLYVKSLIETNTFPLVGMATSHEWLYYGPIYYWILIPLSKLFSFNPFILFWLAFLVSVLGLIINFYIIKKIVNKNVAIYSTVLIGLSPIFIWQTRLSKLHVFFFLLTPILIYLLKLIWDKNKKYVFWLGLTFGVFFSFHFSQIPLFLVILTVFLIKKYKIKDYLMLFLGIIIPNLGIIIKDLKILIWLPYRALGLSPDVGSKTPGSFNEFFGRIFFWDQTFWIVGTFVSLFIIIVFFKKYYKTVDKNFFNFYLIFSSLIVFGGLILHKNPPIHYFLPVLPNILYMFAILMDKYFKKLYIYIVFSLLLIFSIWRFDDYKDIDYIPYQKQLEISQKIVSENRDRTINIKRIGPYDYFPENYSQNYKFLIWYLGGKIDDNMNDTTNNVVTINDYENINIK
ncbi:MAG TPA: glycosyltransferase family 39 protein [Patescibacteria group bacterium]|nr:glycosyltransferase family 39 protein [Patescibacteria group bacterium]